MNFFFEPKPKKALNKAYLKKPVDRADLVRFRDELFRLYARLAPSQSEEHVKNLMADFLKASFYGEHYLVNTKDRIDLAISDGAKTKVLFEVKRPANTQEMLTVAKPNAKALHEVLLYFLRERILNRNLELKHLIITNVDQWFVFDARDLEELATKDKDLVRHFEAFESGALPFSQTTDFYGQVAKPWFETRDGDLWAVNFSLEDLVRSLTDQPDKLELLLPIYKLLSPAHLMGEPFQNDSNTLDRNFYGELLYWIGLEETREGSKTVIRRPAAPQPGSLIELILDRLSLDNRGVLPQDQWDVALELSFLWVNRLVFLKLLESQLLTYHNQDRHYSFMGPNDLYDFGDLYNLFFAVLAVRPLDRGSQHFHRWARIPYMNSRLFELSPRENAVFSINHLDNNVELAPYHRTVLKGVDGKRDTHRHRSLEYLLSFLDAFDFASEGTGEIQDSGKTLINASVLGLIFEKINGYKEGAFFTPGYITQYMARQSVQSAILTKFNQVKGWNCLDFVSLHNQIKDLAEANALIDSLKILDPAVGSGHFLVSVLNELIAAKSELGILIDEEGKLLRDYRVVVENDELFVIDGDGEFVTYRAPFGFGDRQRVWMTLFREKKTLIEKCLFGVDINPNSVQICKLRLWIELLKHSFYTPKSGFQDLETLPNLDIKIREGNSLVSRYGLEVSLEKIGRTRPGFVTDLMKLVGEYQKTTDRNTKNEIEVHIQSIKSEIRADLEESRPLRRKLELVKDRLDAIPLDDLFGFSETELAVRKKKRKPLEIELTELQAQVDDDARNPIYRNSFEWRFEFCEVLDPNTGAFVGFDVVIGNPPYIRIQEFPKEQVAYFGRMYSAASGNYDIYVNFVEQAKKLLSQDSLLALILPNKWFRTDYGRQLRLLLSRSRAVKRIVDFGYSQVFDQASIYTCLVFAHQSPSESFEYAECAATRGSLESAAFQIRESSSLSEKPWTLGSGLAQELMNRLSSENTRLLDLPAEMSRGSSTGADPVFLLSKEMVDQNSIETEILRRPLFATNFGRYEFSSLEDQWIIYPYFKLGDEIRLLPEKELANRFPNAYKYLVRNQAVLERRKQFSAWYGFSAPRNLALHERADIVVPLLANRGEFARVPGDVVAQLCPMASGGFSISLSPSAQIGPNALLGLLNSRLIFWLLRQTSNLFRGGWITCTKQYFGELPIARGIRGASTPSREIKQIESLVAQILAAKKAKDAPDTQVLEDQVDKLVYQLYGLTEDEIRVVES